MSGAFKSVFVVDGRVPPTPEKKPEHPKCYSSWDLSDISIATLGFGKKRLIRSQPRGLAPLIGASTMCTLMCLKRFCPETHHLVMSGHRFIIKLTLQVNLSNLSRYKIHKISYRQSSKILWGGDAVLSYTTVGRQCTNSCTIVGRQWTLELYYYGEAMHFRSCTTLGR